MNRRNRRGRLSAPIPRFGSVAVLVGALAVSAGSCAPSSARAGSRDVEILFVRLDDGSDAAATSCASTVRTTLRSAAGETVHLMALPRDTVMTRLGVSSFLGFIGWPRERLAQAVNEHQAAQLDALVMLDCQPAEQRLDLIVIAGTSRVATAEPQRLSVRHTEITASVARFAGTVAAGWQQTDFSP